MSLSGSPPEGFAPSCAEGGVFGVLPGIMGALQAAEAIKLLTGVGTSLKGRLIQFDALDMQFREFAISRDPECCICSDQPTQHGLIDYASFCGIGAGTAAEDQAAPRIVDPHWLKAQMDSNAPLQLIDVRSVEEFRIARIDGARLIPLDEIEVQAGSLDPSVPIVLLLQIGNSFRARRPVSDVERPPRRQEPGRRLGVLGKGDRACCSNLLNGSSMSRQP